jgi:Tfp pilus assembly protein PilE
MGQQQLLLVILVTVIVGIATIVGINIFGSAAGNANIDAVRNDLVSIAAASQRYYIKPGALGGGGKTFDNMSWQKIGGIPGTVNSDGDLKNENGVYAFKSAPAGQSFTVVATPASESGNASPQTIEITVCPDNAEMGKPGETAPDCG